MIIKHSLIRLLIYLKDFKLEKCSDYEFQSIKSALHTDLKNSKLQKYFIIFQQFQMLLLGSLGTVTQFSIKAIFLHKPQLLNVTLK